MTTELYIHCFIACLIGNIVHVAFKIKSLTDDHKIANLQFSLWEYLKMDKWALLLDIIASFALVYIIDEWLDMDSRIISKIKTLFFFVGLTGSYVVLTLTSVAKKRFRAAVDHKTNKADEIDGTLGTPTPTK